MSHRYAVTVVGGGLVGATAALLFARSGCSVALIEPQPMQVATGKFGLDLRTVALNPQSAQLLQRIGLELGAEDGRRPSWAHPYQNMQVWEERGLSRLHFSAAEVARNELGWIVELSPLTAGLMEKCSAQTQVYGAAVETMQAEENHVSLQLTDGQTLETEWVVAADGGASKVRNLAQIGLQTFALEQHALGTLVQTERPHASTAWQCFLRSGPLAFLPVASDKAPASNLVSVVWSQAPDQAKARAALSDIDFCAALTRASEASLGQVVDADRRVVFPLRQQCAKAFYQGRVVLLGDAARVVHPLAGLGVNIGFEDLSALDEVWQQGPGERGLHRWASRRRLRSLQMIRLLDGLNRFYAQKSPLTGLLRNAGVQFFDSMAPLKNQIMREAMGLGPLARATQSSVS